MLALNLVTRVSLASLFLILITIDTIEFAKSYSEFYGKVSPYNLIAYSAKLIQIAVALAIALAGYERKIIRTIVWVGVWLVFSIFSSLPTLLVKTAGLDTVPHIALAVIFQISSLGFALAITERSNVKAKQGGDGKNPQLSIFAQHDVLSDEDVISSFLSESIVRAKDQNIGARDLYNAYSRYCDELAAKAVAERLFSGIVKANNISHKRQSKGSFYLGVTFKPNGSKQLIGAAPEKVA